MLFNSQEFVFFFLPVSLVIYLAIGAISRNGALHWIILASLIFYAWWNPHNLLIIVPALAANFATAKAIEHLDVSSSGTARFALLLVGVLFNIGILGYFKYANFGILVLNDAFSANLVFRDVVLPLGISFITFQNIAFLVDVHGGKIKSFSLRDYCLFALFFPQLIAGPIVHFRETVPQFLAIPGRTTKQDVSIGITLFAFGLFKKVVLADQIAIHVNEIYELSASGQPVSLIPAWLGAIGFTLQIYFDFSGYTDMALGSARVFGIRLPVNFMSPLKSSSIIDFWLRWHVSLTKFLTAYLYNPLSLAISRRRLGKGEPLLSPRQFSLGPFLQILAIPTMFTMFISGIWHGAGYLFLLWGLLHGLYLTINHAWRFTVARLFRDRTRYEAVMRPVGFVLTFASVVVSMVIFRSRTADACAEILIGMAGLNGLAVPGGMFDSVAGQFLKGFLPELQRGIPGISNLSSLLALTLSLSAIAFLLPNSIEVMGRYDAALGYTCKSQYTQGPSRFILWQPNAKWLLVTAAMACTAIYFLGGPSEFLYWQF